jgi:hypothetical protein
MSYFEAMIFLRLENSTSRPRGSWPALPTRNVEEPLMSCCVLKNSGPRLQASSRLTMRSSQAVKVKSIVMAFSSSPVCSMIRGTTCDFPRVNTRSAI